MDLGDRYRRGQQEMDEIKADLIVRTIAKALTRCSVPMILLDEVVERLMGVVNPEVVAFLSEISALLKDVSD